MFADSFQLPLPLSPSAPHLGKLIQKPTPPGAPTWKLKPGELSPTSNHSENQGPSLLLSLRPCEPLPACYCLPLPRKPHNVSAAAFSGPFGCTCCLSCLHLQPINWGGVHPPSTKGHNSKTVTLALVLGLSRYVSAWSAVRKES